MWGFLVRLVQAVAKYGKAAVDYVWRNGQKLWQMYANGTAFEEIVEMIGNIFG